MDQEDLRDINELDLRMWEEKVGMLHTEDITLNEAIGGNDYNDDINCQRGFSMNALGYVRLAGVSRVLSY